MTTDRLPYQYVVLRCVPHPEREEFINVGVLLFCESARYLGVAWRIDEVRLRAFAPTLDCERLAVSMRFIEAVCAGESSAGAAAAVGMNQRFGFLKAPRSTILQPGPVHGGLAADPAAELVVLRDRYVIA